MCKRVFHLSRVACAFAAIALLALPVSAERVLIRAAKPYDNLVAAIQQNGGTVTHQFKYVQGIAADIPSAALARITAMLPAGAVSKDLVVALPRPADSLASRRLQAQSDTMSIPADSVQALGAAEVAALSASSPDAYLINNAGTGVSSLIAGGYAGQGVIVAVIDSGIRPGFPHISLDGSVIGCEDFVGDANGCSNAANDGHGTFVAGMISANVVFSFGTASATRNAVLAECPACFANPPTNTQIPMIGSAPFSSIYAFRVFGPTGGAPTSRIIAAAERVIELKELYDAGNPAGRNIQVANFSLGGPTLFPGMDLFDKTIDVMLAKNIVPVISAGNAGPSSLTVGSPGTSISAITVGAASIAINERILRRLQLGSVNGPLYRPFLGTQMAYFSSRGPNADGRTDPDVVASGFANYGQGFGATAGSISIASGTSFSAPTVAGIAAVLRQRHPGATARQIRNAILASANPAGLADGSVEMDRGRGFVNAPAASSLLSGGMVPDTLDTSSPSNTNVKVNIERGTSLKVRDGSISENAVNLKPGQRHDVLYRVQANTKQVVVVVSGFSAALPPAQQNQLFGDDILLAIHSAKTSAIGEGDYQVFDFTRGGTYVVDNPEAGIMRITLNGDWTNAGAVSARVSVFSLTDPVPQLTSQGKVDNGDLIVIPINVPAGVSKAEFRLGWREDWSSYPANDVDLILVSPSGTANLNGATLSNPENVVVDNPAQGQWLALVSGFEVYGGSDKYELRVALDGKVVK